MAEPQAKPKITVGHEQLDAIMEHLICPLSGKLFQNPVVSNNALYEASELEKVPGYDTNYTPVITIKSFIDDLVKDIPELQQFRYVETEEKRNYAMNKTKIITLLDNKKYDGLLKYNSFCLADIGGKIESVLKGATDQVVIHLIDNALDPNAVFALRNSYGLEAGLTKWKIIHCVARWGNPAILTHLVNNGMDVNAVVDGDLYTPLQLAAVDSLYTGAQDKIHRLLDLGANPFVKDKHGNSSLYYICNYSSYACIKSVIEKLAQNLVDLAGLETVELDKLMTALQNSEKLEINHVMDCAECLMSVFSK